MGPALLWFALGYASCVWDCASSPLDARWPSATGVFIVLLAMRVPSRGLWGAALCGLVMDAGQGGPLGPRVFAGVIAAALASHANLGRGETYWTRAAFAFFVAIALWLSVQLLPLWNASQPGLGRWMLVSSWGTTTLSTTLILLTIRSLTTRRETTL